MAKASKSSSTRGKARRPAIKTAPVVRVYGLPLTGRGKDDHVAIRWCGLSVDEGEHRERKALRIWHLPKAAIMQTGVAKKFLMGGRKVNWYDLKRDSSPMEETYTPVSLQHAIRLYLGGKAGETVAMGRFLNDQTPITISPNPTTSPTGTPPITVPPRTDNGQAPVTISPNPTTAPTGTPPITISPSPSKGGGWRPGKPGKIKVTDHRQKPNR